MTQKKAAFSDVRNHQIILELKILRISAREIFEVFTIFVRVWGCHLSSPAESKFQLPESGF